MGRKWIKKQVELYYNHFDHNTESIYNITLHRISRIIIQQLDEHKVQATEKDSTAANTPKRRSFKPIHHKLHPYVKRKEKSDTNHAHRYTQQSTVSLPRKKLTHIRYFVYINFSGVQLTSKIFITFLANVPFNTLWRHQ